MNKQQECNHCDHNQGTIHHTAGQTTSYICCHCGRTRQEHVPVKPGNAYIHEKRPPGHGPYVPHQTITFAEDREKLK